MSPVVKVFGCRPHDGGAARTGPGTTTQLGQPPANKNGGPFDPPPVMPYRLVMKVHVPLARQRPKGPDTGMVQFLLYGLVGAAPAMLSSWLAHRYADEPKAAHST